MLSWPTTLFIYMSSDVLFSQAKFSIAKRCFYAWCRVEQVAVLLGHIRFNAKGNILLILPVSHLTISIFVSRQGVGFENNQNISEARACSLNVKFASCISVHYQHIIVRYTVLLAASYPIGLKFGFFMELFTPQSFDANSNLLHTRLVKATPRLPLHSCKMFENICHV